jgi:hypothetical protein
MSVPNPEFSRLVPVTRLGSEPSRHEIAASATECRRLARRFDLLTLDRLAAVVTLQRQSGGRIRLEATFEAEFAQSCIVTLEPVSGKIVEKFVLLYGPAENAPIDIDPDIDEGLMRWWRTARWSARGFGIPLDTRLARRSESCRFW